MSGSNALAAAKRRRVGGIEPNKPTPRGAVAGQIQRGNVVQVNGRLVARPPTQQSVPQNKNQPVKGPAKQIAPVQNVKLTVNNKFTDNDNDDKSQDYSQLPESSRFFMIPPLSSSPINPLQLLAVVHRYFNKLAYHLPNAVDTLGTNFNLLSSNCDNLNERLEHMESLNSQSDSGDNNNVNQVGNNQVQALREEYSQELKTEFLKVRNEISKMKEDFKREISSLRDDSVSSINSLRNELLELRALIEQGEGEVETDANDELENVNDVLSVDDGNIETLEVNNEELVSAS